MSEKKNIPKEVKISQDKLRTGIALSLDNSLKHLDGVTALIEKDCLDCAVILTWFAIEEFGRAVYLRERLQKGVNTIEETLERSHKLKYEKAFSVLPTELKTISKDIFGGYWGKGYWGGGYWGESAKKETISPETRLKPIYLHFDEKTQQWERGIIADKEKLKQIVSKMKDCILKFDIS
jgi:hypothetical protein